MTHIHAVILAAGRGKRLSVETDHLPKALLPIGPRSLEDPSETNFLRRQIEVLRGLGVAEITVVVGYKGELLREGLRQWGQGCHVVENPTPSIETSGSLHSFQFAQRAGEGVLGGEGATWIMDADIIYHPGVLHALLQPSDRSRVLVCETFEESEEEVMVFCDPQTGLPQRQGKGLIGPLTAALVCAGEAAGIVSIAPGDHAIAKVAMDWLLGDPDAPEGTLRHRGFGPAKRATEHEELTQFLMQLGRVDVCRFDGREFPFMECDTPEEYAELRARAYPALLAMT